jgi:nucleoside 2-deoxyribosyltransferase
VYLPQRDTPETQAAERTTAIFYASLAALRKADALVAVCDGSQVDDGTAREIGYAYGKNNQFFYPPNRDALVGMRPAVFLQNQSIACLPSVAECASVW